LNFTKHSVFFSSQTLANMNGEYRSALTLHDPDADLAWWDENYGK